MSNQTDPKAKQVHGGNPQSLVDQIVRNRIYSHSYWKEKLAGANDRGMELKYIGGTYGGNRKPSSFLCLVLKLLQIQPDKRVIYAYIENPHHKYIRALGLFYLRLTGSAAEIYTVCEKFISDPRPMNVREISGEYRLKYMDEFVDELTREQIMFDVVLPRLPKRETLQEQGLLEEKISPLETELQRLMEEELETGKEPAGTRDDNGGDEESETKKSRELSEKKKKDKKHRDRSRSRSKEKKDKKKKSKRKGSEDSSDDERDAKKKNKKKLKKLLKEERKRQEREKERSRGAERKETEEEYRARLRREQGLA